VRLDQFYFEVSYSRQIWLTEMKYLTNLTEVNKMLCFDFEYMVNILVENEKARQAKNDTNVM
jgi:hypothetical protein